MKKLLAFPLILLLLALSACASPGGIPQDGYYTVRVALSGGSGRASISSPAEMTAADGKLTAVIQWSSPYYEYMRLDGVTYYPVNTEGNSTFEIPVVLDEDMAVTAETIAMSQPHEIDYTLRFDSATIRSLGESSRLLPIIVGAGAVIVIAILAVSIFYKNHKKSRA